MPSAGEGEEGAALGNNEAGSREAYSLSNPSNRCLPAHGLTQHLAGNLSCSAPKTTSAPRPRRHHPATPPAERAPNITTHPKKDTSP